MSKPNIGELKFIKKQVKERERRDKEWHPSSNHLIPHEIQVPNVDPVNPFSFWNGLREYARMWNR